MEYRFFYPITESIYDTKWRVRSGIEKRTDIYFLFPSPENKLDEFNVNYGLKLRKKKILELKEREKSFPNGQEYWIKTIRSDKKIDINDTDAIIKILRKHNENQLIQRLSSQPIIICYVGKFRQQKPLGSCLTQELTGIELKFFPWNNQTQIGKDLHFETVCIEQPGSKPIDGKFIEELVTQYEDYTITPMGYPEFLFRQHQQINQ